MVLTTSMGSPGNRCRNEHSPGLRSIKEHSPGLRSIKGPPTRCTRHSQFDRTAEGLGDRLPDDIDRAVPYGLIGDVAIGGPAFLV